eukprot:CAMPEP_0181219778 /NCGR_PEP_ID=MMETSP1096-20121128/28472_1 /TAXON_ID=156174 ORGANISM="Chrysochromulina ericina, Strain CCMP281" /NCGR_SAMPLE_ID=MMETSP1096 /ASSEMBLY_ACC=CAM_ASM_000453 /LENGTH=99 /DNA_ID=CAMNT_0023312211 /DNA_START=357 /DNA_END=652 /DNA_ORIENTATION=-
MGGVGGTFAIDASTADASAAAAFAARTSRQSGRSAVSMSTSKNASSLTSPSHSVFTSSSPRSPSQSLENMVLWEADSTLVLARSDIVGRLATATAFATA